MATLNHHAADPRAQVAGIPMNVTIVELRAWLLTLQDLYGSNYQPLVGGA